MAEEMVIMELAIIKRTDGHYVTVEGGDMGPIQIGPCSSDDAELYVNYLRDYALKHGGVFIPDGPKQ